MDFEKKTHFFFIFSNLSLSHTHSSIFSHKTPSGRLRHRARDGQHRALRRRHRRDQRHPRELPRGGRGKPRRGRAVAALCARVRPRRVPLHQRFPAEHFRARSSAPRSRKRCAGGRRRLQVGPDEDEVGARRLFGGRRDQADVDRLLQPPRQQRREEPLGAADLQEQGDLQGQRGGRHGKRERRRRRRRRRRRESVFSY